MGGVSRRPSPQPAPAVGAGVRSKPTSKPGGTKPEAGKKRVVPQEVTREDGAPPRQITVRTLVLAVVILMAFVLITPTLRAYVRQQEDLRILNQELAAAQEEARTLDSRIEQWNDDDFIRAQARDRFGFVMPGETRYRVINPAVDEAERQELESDLTSSLPRGPGPWYLDVWESVQIAGEMEP